MLSLSFSSSLSSLLTSPPLPPSPYTSLPERVNGCQVLGLPETSIVIAHNLMLDMELWHLMFILLGFGLFGVPSLFPVPPLLHLERRCLLFVTVHLRYVICFYFQFFFVFEKGFFCVIVLADFKLSL